jgi:hypothetical protein
MAGIDPTFRERYLRSRNTPMAVIKIMRSARRAKDAANRRRRAGAMLDVSLLGGDWDAAVAASGMTTQSLRVWLYKQTGSSVWPLSGAQRAKLAYLAEKYN